MKLIDAIDVPSDVYCNGYEIDHVLVDEENAEFYFGEIDGEDFITVNVNQEIELNEVGEAKIVDIHGDEHTAQFFVTLHLSEEFLKAHNE